MPSASMSDLRSVIEDALANRTYLEKVKSVKHIRLLAAEKISVRRMMSCYWESSSRFSLDLVGAVIRQGTFIERMHSIDWIHPPAVTSIMKRLLVKYDRYFLRLANFSGKIAIPTLDVDLA